MSDGAGTPQAGGDADEWRQRVEAKLSALSTELAHVAAADRSGSLSSSALVENPLASTGDETQASSATTGLVEAVIKRTVAGMQGSPTNVHQVTAALLTSEGKRSATMRYFVGSFLVIFAQTAVCTSIISTALWPSCTKSSDCARHRGGWCSPDRNCWSCLNTDDDGAIINMVTNISAREFCHPSNLTLQTFQDQPRRLGAGAPPEVQESLASETPEAQHKMALDYCHGCWDDLDPDVWQGTSTDAYVMDMLALMKAGDYFALLLVTAVVCIQASNEARDGNNYPQPAVARAGAAAATPNTRESSLLLPT